MSLLKMARSSHDDQMERCKQSNGCDRHLMGLKIAADHLLDYTPELFKDKAFEIRFEYKVLAYAMLVYIYFFLQWWKWAIFGVHKLDWIYTNHRLYTTNG